MTPRTAPAAALDEFVRESFRDEDYTCDVYRMGVGPAVLVLTEMPGISPQVLGFAKRISSAGFTVVLPDLFGEAGRDPFAPSLAANAGYTLGTVARACISREFTVFVGGRRSPVVDRLRTLARREHARCGGPGVGVVGMCFTGGFALAMAVDPVVLAPVLSQPSMPMPLSAAHAASVDCSPAELDVVAGRCASEGLTVLGMRFHGDPLVPAARFRALREKLGDGFVGIELDQADGNPANQLPRHHSVLTGSLVDDPGSPTRRALDEVVGLFRRRLLPVA